MTGALFAQSVCLADGGVQVDGQGPVAGSDANRPGPGHQLPAHPVQLADVAPPETAQEGPQSGRRLDHAAQHPGRSARPQRIGVIDAVPADQGGHHQGQQLVARVGPARRISQVNVVVHEFTQTQVLGEGGRKEQPSIGHQAVIVEGRANAF